MWKQLKRRGVGGNLATIQNDPDVSNGGEIETNMCVYKVGSRQTSIAFPPCKK